MFFIVSKILSYLLTPVFWVLALLIVALLIKSKTLSKRLILFPVVLFYLLSNCYLADVFMRNWGYPVQNLKADSSYYDAGIVLGGGIITYDEVDRRLIFRSSADRGLQALQLYKQGRIKKILITVGPGSIVYSAIHTRHSLGCFEKVGLKVTPYAVG